MESQNIRLTADMCEGMGTQQGRGSSDKDGE